MISYILTFCGGILFTFFVMFIWISIDELKNKDKKLQKFSRRGICQRNYTTFGGDAFFVEYEVGEIEKTSTKSKLKVINSISSMSIHNSSDIKKNELNAYLNDAWVLSSDIEWIEESLEDKRDEKLTKLLG